MTADKRLVSTQRNIPSGSTFNIRKVGLPPTTIMQRH